MNLRRIRAGSIWTIYAIAGDRMDPRAPGQFECDMLDALRGWKDDARYGRSVVRLTTQLDLIQDHPLGPAALRDNCHHICKATVSGRSVTIWQITSNDLRVLFFYDENKVVICSHVFPKQGQKTPGGEKERAKAACVQYFTERLQRNRQ